MPGKKSANTNTSGTTRTMVTKTASVADTANKMTRKSVKVQAVANQTMSPTPLTERETRARMAKKYATTTFGFNTRKAFDSAGIGDVSNSSGGNFYSPQLSTDFLEKPQNLRERRAWYRHFYNSNEFVGKAVDLHSTLPLSKIRLEKPKCKNSDYADYVYDFFVDMCDDVKLFKTLLEISHEYNLLGNCAKGDSRLRTPEGFKTIRDIEVGDEVLTHTNTFKAVTNKCSRKSDHIYKIKIFKSHRIIELTGEHPVEVLRDSKVEFVKVGDLKPNDHIRLTYSSLIKDVERVNYLEKFDQITPTSYGYSKKVNIIRGRVKEAQECREKFLSWIGSLDSPTIKTREELAEELGVIEIKLNSVLTQLNKEIEKESYSRRIGALGYQKGSQVEWLPMQYDPGDGLYEITRVNKYKAPQSIAIDEDFCYLLGYWLGDGTLARDNSRPGKWGRGIWNIVFGKGSEKQLDKVRGILEDKLGEYAVKEWDYTRDYNGKESVLTTLKVNGNPAFLEWWASNFGETCTGNNPKRIPQWIHNLPANKLCALLAGLIDSDGCTQESITVITTISESLAVSMFEISLKCGILVGTREYYTRPEKSKLIMSVNPELASRKCYTVTLDNFYCADTVGCHSIKIIASKARSLKNSDRHKELGNGDFFYRLESLDREEFNDVVYNIEVEGDHTYQVEGISTHNCFIFAEDHSPYEAKDDDEATEDKINELKEAGKIRSDKLFQDFEVVDKDPNYLGWRRLLVLPPDQVRIKKIPLSDESLIEFIPDPETKKNILQARQGMYPGEFFQTERNPYKAPSIPEKLAQQLEENGTIPLDTDPYSGSHVFHLARKKSQYETLGVSVLERCINTLLLQDKLRQSQTSIASRHMTPIRIVWAEDLSEPDVENLREQVDLALVDPDFSIITNYQVNWEEMGSNGRLLELTGEYEHIENSLFAGLGVTREILTGEGTYSGNRITLEIMNTQYLLDRELLQEYVENSLFKPVAKKKGFVEKDKFGREKLIYPKLSFTRLAIRDNDEFFNQVFQLYNKGSVSIDVILDMLNIDPESSSKKIKEDLFTVDDFAYNQLMTNIYTAAGQGLVEKYNVLEKLADYLGFDEVPQPEGGEEAGGADAGGMPRFASDKKEVKKKESPKIAAMPSNKKAALQKMLNLAMQNPDKLEKIMQYLEKSK